MDPKISTQSHFDPKSCLGVKNWDCKCSRCPNRHCHKTKNFNGLWADTISHLCIPIHSYFNRTNMIGPWTGNKLIFASRSINRRAGLQSISIVGNNHSLVLQRLMIGPITTGSLRSSIAQMWYFPQNNYLFSVLTLPYFGSTYKNDCDQWIILNWMAAIFIARINNGMYFSAKKIVAQIRDAFRKCF